jgi:hypothetical protein
MSPGSNLFVDAHIDCFVVKLDARSTRNRIIELHVGLPAPLESSATPPERNDLNVENETREGY